MSAIATWDEFEIDSKSRPLNESIATEPAREVNPAWESCINALVDAWYLVDDGIVVPPNRAAISAACQWLIYLRSLYPSSPPSLIVREPNGGIIIQQRNRSIDGHEHLFELTLYNDGKAEVTQYIDGRIVTMRFVPTIPSTVKAN